MLVTVAALVVSRFANGDDDDAVAMEVDPTQDVVNGVVANEEEVVQADLPRTTVAKAMLVELHVKIQEETQYHLSVEEEHRFQGFLE